MLRTILLIPALLLCLACKKNRNKEADPAVAKLGGSYTGTYYKEAPSGEFARMNVKVTFSGARFTVDGSNNPAPLPANFDPTRPGIFQTRGQDSIFMQNFSPVSSLYSHNFRYYEKGDSMIFEGWRGAEVYEFLRLKKLP